MKTNQKQKLVAGIKKRVGNLTPNNLLEKYLHFLDSASKVVDFYYEDEKKHYECSIEKKDHIFSDLKLIKEFLKRVGRVGRLK